MGTINILDFIAIFHTVSLQKKKKKRKKQIPEESSVGSCTEETFALNRVIKLKIITKYSTI